MKIFDLHCDTAGECYNQGVSLKNNNLHISLERAAIYDSYTQLFAVWIPDELRGEDAVNYFNNVADNFYGEVALYNNLISMYGDSAQTPVKAIMTVEGGSACGGTLDGLNALYKKGVRVITLTWNDKNEIASGAFSEGGFTVFGKEFVKMAENLGIVLDVSHLNRQSFFEFAEISTKPFIASHSNADIVDNPYGKKRNLTKEQLNIIKERQGLVGLNYCRDFIENPGVLGVDALAEQVSFFIKNGYENIMSLGSDFDGCEIHQDLCGVEKTGDVYHRLLQKGFSKEALEKLFWKNAENFFHNI